MKPTLFTKKISYVSKYFFIILFCLCSISLLVYADQKQLTNQLQKTLSFAVLESQNTPGAVLLISSPDLGTVAVAAGVEDIETNTPMRVNNNFRLASITKTFLAITVLKLSQDGVLNLNDKIANLLPGTIKLDHLPNGKKATVKQLLGMRSGIPNYTDYKAYTKMVEANPNHHWIPEDGVAIIYDEKPSFAPGKSYEYVNTNYLLLQSIVETATGTPIAKQIRKFIFDPLQLKHTYFEIQEEQQGGFHGLVTHGYELDKNDKMVDVTTLNDGLGLGDGGVVSTAQDLAKFVQALLQYQTLLPKKLLDEMLIVQGPDKYGLGIYREQVGEEWAWTHNGTSSGFRTQFYYFPNRKLTMIILTNCFDSDLIETVAPEILKIIDKNK